jgi:hypothetical protein
MKQDEKIKKVCEDFSLLSEEQQEYILGILQALVYAKTASNLPSTEKPAKAAPPNSGA